MLIVNIMNEFDRVYTYIRINAHTQERKKPARVINQITSAPALFEFTATINVRKKTKK